MAETQDHIPKYLGEEELKIQDTVFRDYTPQDWVMYYIESYGQTDGDHHKAWLLDQIARIIKGARIIITVDKWDNEVEVINVDIGEPTPEYWQWIKEVKSGEDGPETYSYKFGIAP